MGGSPVRRAFSRSAPRSRQGSKTKTGEDEADEDGRATEGVRSVPEGGRAAAVTGGGGRRGLPGGPRTARSDRVVLRRGRLPQLPGQVALAVYTTGRQTRQKILSVPGVTPHQRGDFELPAVFLPAALEAVARVIRARRRRSLSAAHRAAALAGLERARAARRADVGADQAVGAS